MRLDKNRIIAGAVCAVCAVVSIFGLGGWKLSNRQRSLEEIFTYGTDPELATRHSMDAYLDRCSEYSAELAQVAKLYLDDYQSIEEVLELSEMLCEDDGISDRYSVYKALTACVEDMYSELQVMGAYEDSAVITAYHDYTGAQNLIKNDGYHKAAADYNKVLSAFPANVISGLFGVEKAETFGQ